MSQNHGGAPPPPPPPPHGSNPKTTRGGFDKSAFDKAGLDPEHSQFLIVEKGGGVIYLPSLYVHRNSFLAGAFSMLLVIVICSIVAPVAWVWIKSVTESGGGMSVFMLVGIVGIGAWALGKTSAEGGGSSSKPGPTGDSGGPPNAGPSWNSGHTGPDPNAHSSPPPPPNPEPHSPPPPKPQPQPKPRHTANDGPSAWERAKAQMKAQAEEKKRRDEKEAAEKAAKLAEDKVKWESRMKEAKERVERERKERERVEKDAKEKAEREARAKATREAREKIEREAREKVEREVKAKVEREAKEKAEREAREKASRPVYGVGERTNIYGRPVGSKVSSAPTGQENQYSYRPYDQPKRPAKQASASSFYSDASSYFGSETTATTPPPRPSGPFVTNDEKKIVLKAVYQFGDSFPRKPKAQLQAGMVPVTDGLVLRMDLEGLFLDDEVRQVQEREWDVKLWTMKSIESAEVPPYAIIRVTTKDADNTRYIFILSETEYWKVGKSLARLKSGATIQRLSVNNMDGKDAKKLLMSLGWQPQNV
ncbi:hypothetical protein P152DRAFT_131136 [Eremomyces bilateralis CBS 781.70]|uniref:Uncharacterized protein n=1 Tax=Eremomyces bilateralis CBS 781.70 TaxID=1392243 RepID=A0A6G1GF05_9PEZI|nr:uncharacterized protein P152DRAFT_131136 [Eremomyces bilateralis CBS 781.70]KAF1816648.1 hypothetical protein P152DRAFT_131136 [Eremomyces bilateralis CBS 781.70]